MNGQNYTILIEANGESKEYIKDIIRYRELFFFFAWRDISVRYKQAFFGASWALLRPLLNMAIFTFIFGYMAKLPSEGVDYFLFVLAGMLPWQLYSGACADTCLCLVNNPQLVSKVYFPRIIIPLAQIIVHLLDFSIAFLFVTLVAIAMGQLSFYTFIYLPFFLLLALTLISGTSLWLSALTVRYRDFRHIIPFFIQFAMLLSPVGYGSSIIPEGWRTYYLVNPLVGIINSFRYSFFGIAADDFALSLVLSFFISSGLLLSGFLFFRKMEKTFADTI